MSQAPPTSASTSPSNFQTILHAALKAYEKKTKKDLIAHPLAAQLQACKSSGDILAVLQEKVKEFEQSRSADERLLQWLNPTINVLYSFSTTLGTGVGLVSIAKYAFFYLLSPVSQVFSPASVIFSGIGVLLSVRPTSLMLAWGQFMKSLVGGKGCRSQPRRSHRSLRAYRELLQATRVLYLGAPDRRDD